MLNYHRVSIKPEPRLPPSIAAYNAAAAAAAAAGAWRSVLQLLQGAAQRSLQQSPVTLGTALNARSLEKFMGHLMIYVHFYVYLCVFIYVYLCGFIYVYLCAFMWFYV